MLASSYLLEARSNEAETQYRHRRGAEEQGVGSEEANLQRPSGGPPCSSPLRHPVAERQLAFTGWLALAGPL